MIRFSTLFFSIVFIIGCKVGNATFEAGSSAPDFSFKLLSGEEKKLSDYRGTPVVLHFWASWCENCKIELPALDALSKKLGSRATFLSIGVLEDPKIFIPFATAQKVSFLTGVPLDPATAGLYKLTGVPETFVLDREGKFKLLQDPRSGNGYVRFLGTFNWDQPEVIQQIIE